MKLAGIDFGTNSVRLLVCDCIDKDNRIYLKTIKRQTKITQLGKNLHNTNLISDSAISKTKKALDEFKSILNVLKPEKTSAVATSVFRCAENGVSVQRELENYCGFPIQIVTGVEEANLMFKGMFANRNARKKTMACLDIGGGSCEFIFTKNNKIVFNKSYNIGCLRSKNKFFLNDPPGNSEIESLTEHVKQTVSSDLKKYSADYLICFGGTVTSLAAIFNKNLPVDIESLENFTVEKKDVDNFIKNTNTLSKNELAEKYSGYLDKGRESVIFSGAVIISCLMDILNKNAFTVTNQGILFGLISELFKTSFKKN